MSAGKTIMAIIGAALSIIGIGGIPIFALEKDLIRTGFFVMLLVFGIIILGYTSKS